MSCDRLLDTRDVCSRAASRVLPRCEPPNAPESMSRPGTHGLGRIDGEPILSSASGGLPGYGSGDVTGVECRCRASVAGTVARDVLEHPPCGSPGQRVVPDLVAVATEASVARRLLTALTAGDPI